MRKQTWKHKLIVQKFDDDGSIWLSNDHWAVKDTLASRIKGLKNALNLRSGIYRDYEYVEEFRGDMRKVAWKGCNADDARPLTDTGVRVRLGAEELELRVLVHGERAYAIDERYSEFLDLGLPIHIQDEAYKVTIGDLEQPEAVVMIHKVDLEVVEAMIIEPEHQDPTCGRLDHNCKKSCPNLPLPYMIYCYEHAREEGVRLTLGDLGAEIHRLRSQLGVKAKGRSASIIIPIKL